MDEHQAHIVSTARTEAERMRKAVAGADVDTKVHMPTAQFAKLAEVIDMLCDLLVGEAEVQSTRLLEQPQKGASLGELERFLLAAEDVFAMADRRLHGAVRDRDAAMDVINTSQSAIDEILLQLRSRSPEGSRWHQPDSGVLTLTNPVNLNEQSLIRNPGADDEHVEDPPPAEHDLQSNAA